MASSATLRTPILADLGRGLSGLVRRLTAASVPSTPAVPRAASPITWAEPAESFWLLSLRNFGLTLATFGIYHFWGRAEARRRITNAVRINGQRLDHTGSGREAFVSFLLGALVAVGLTSVFLSLMQQSSGGIEGVRQIRWQRLTITLPLLFLLGSVVYRKRSHILRRTWLSGRRFDLSGHAWAYAWQHFWTAFLVPLTLGWAAPWRTSRLEAIKIRDMHHAETRFRAEPALAPLYRAFAVLWFGGGLVYMATLVVLAVNVGPELMAALEGVTFAPLLAPGVVQRGVTILAAGLLPLIGFILAYRKAWLEHQVSSIAFDGGRLSLELPLAGYLWLTLSNAALRFATLGALTPVAEARAMRFLVEHVRVEGALAPELFETGELPKDRAQ